MEVCVGGRWRGGLKDGTSEERVEGERSGVKERGKEP